MAWSTGPEGMVEMAGKAGRVRMEDTEETAGMEDVIPSAYYWKQVRMGLECRPKPAPSHQRAKVIRCH